MIAMNMNKVREVTVKGKSSNDMRMNLLTRLATNGVLNPA